MNKQNISAIIKSILQNIAADNFKGYDPYDGVSTRYKILQKYRHTRLFCQYFNKFSPLNLRPLFGINKQVFPQVLAYYGLIIFKLKLGNQYEKELEAAVKILTDISLKEKIGYHCWNSIGFPLQMRTEYSDINEPDVVGGSLIGRFLVQYYQYKPSEQLKEIILSQYDFFLEQLYVNLEQEGFIRYRPNQSEYKATYNASLLASRYLMTVDQTFKTNSAEIIEKCFSFVTSRQQDDGHWFYTINLKTGHEKEQIDFHQGFILDSLLDYMEFYGFDEPFVSSYKMGLEFYYQNQFLPNGQGIYRYPKKWPVNIHNQSQGIITFSRAGQFDEKYLTFANSIADWTVKNMYNEREEYFYYLKYPFLTNKIRYVRWSDSNMLLALSTLIKQSEAYG